jgi:transcriptional regulator with XRE-family HTH domain
VTTFVPFSVALAESLQDPAVRAEWERTAVARELSIWLIRFRNQHRLTQADLAGALGLKQPAVARLEAAEHEPSIATLRRLAARLGKRVSLVLEPDCVKLAIDDELTRCSPETPATVE